MNILFLGSIEKDIALTGAAKVALEVFKRVKSQYQETYFISYFQNGRVYSRFKKLFGKDSFVNNYTMYGLFPLLFYIIRKKPKIIQIIFPAAYYLPALLLAKLLGIKICYLVHQNFRFSIKNNLVPKYEMRRMLFIESFSIFFSDTIFVLSKFDQEVLLNQRNVGKREIYIIDNGINDFNLKKNYQTNILEELNIITVGSFDRSEKGLYFLVNILKSIDRKVHLTICSSLEHKMFCKNIPPNVKIIYRHSLNEIELRQEFINNDMFIASSSYDVFNIALLEAMNSGLLFIATQNIGLTERFSKELLEYVIPYGEIDLGVHKINRLIDLSDSEKQNLSKIIIEFSKNYTWDKVVKKYYKVYESLLNGV